MGITNKNNMKNIKGVFAMILVIALSIASCQEEAPGIGTPLPAEQINLEVSQPLSLSEGGNTVVLRNLTEGVIPMWDYGTGKSIKQIDTVKYAFKGMYTIKRSAMSSGRLVALPDAIVEVTKTDPEVIKDPLWTLLAGGAENEKTWVIDFDADGVSKKFAGPVFFFGEDKVLDPTCTGGEFCWSWEPGWQTWMPGPADYGTMTFNLKGGPFIKVVQKAITNNGVFEGTYSIKPEEKTISFTGVVPLNIGWDQDFTKARIYSITADAMQLGFLKKGTHEYEVYNYIVKP
jgi:hypothetical protein